VLVGDIDPDRDFAAVIDHYDEPVGDSSGVALYTLSRLIAQYVTVVLSGTGGDELFGGYLRYAAARLSRVARLLPGLRRLPQVLGRDESKAGWRGRLAELALRIGDRPLDTYRQILAPTVPQLGRALRRPELTEALGGFSASQVFEQYFDRAAGSSLLTRLMYTDLKTVLPDDYLVKEDRMTMAHSVEGRVPFLDFRIVELAYSLPDSLKMRGVATKLLLRQLAKARLPPSIARGGKQGFEIPAASWLRGQLGDRVRDTLLSPSAQIFEFVDPAVTAQLVRDHLDDRSNHARLIWSLLSLETWMQNARARAVVQTDGARRSADTQ
jgi:asparagine synthase (glutamine-hydrolysing)